MWRTGLLYLDRGDSAIISALRDAGYNTQQSPGSPTRRFSTASSDATEIIWERRVKQDLGSPHPQSVQQWIVPADGNGLKFSRPRSKQEDPADSLSPASDTTLFEEPQPIPLDQIKEDETSHDYFSYDGLQRSPSVKSDNDETVSMPRRRIRHQRATSSIASTLSNSQLVSRTLPIRAKTGDGLLQLQANSSKPLRPAAGHQRKVSLGLPIKANPQTDGNNSPHQQPTLSKRYSNPPPPKETPKPARTPSLIQQERELEYKHRHTFIGTASLDDFLEVLDVTPQHTTTKSAIVRAFLLLASSERLLARQASLAPTGWSLISRTTSNTIDTDYVEQAHAKLGSIVLRQFLDLIPFDEDEEAAAISVVEAFGAASHLDAKAGSGPGSKAKAFRSWMVRQQD